MGEKSEQRELDGGASLQNELVGLAENLATELAQAGPDWKQAGQWMQELHDRWPSESGAQSARS